MSVKEIAEVASAILETRLALAVLLLIALVALVLWIRRRLHLHELALREQLLECRRDAVEDLALLRSVMGATRDYRMLLLSVTGPPNRAPPQQLTEVDRHFEDIRRRIHDAENNRIVRLNESLRKLKEQQAKAQEAAE